MSCTKCKGAKRITRERDLGMGVKETVSEPCSDCIGELRSCNGSLSPQAPNHQLITYRGTLCPLCVALAALASSRSNEHERVEALVLAGKAHA